MYIIVFKPTSVSETRYIGPFTSFGAALEYLTTLPKISSKGIRLVADLEPITSDARLARRKALGHQ